jgi:LPXTG-site transpeptidase (sortase) family protein
MSRILRVAILQIMITGLVFIAWGLLGTAVDVSGQLSDVLGQAGELGGLAGARIVNAQPQVTITPVVLPRGGAGGSGGAGGAKRSGISNENAGLSGAAVDPANAASVMLAPPLPTDANGGAGSAAPLGTPAPFVEPSPTPLPPSMPDRLVISKIGLDAPVVIAPRLTLQVGQDLLGFWSAPNEFAVGWHEGSAFLGETGNTVLSGHHNVYGKVFARLVELAPGDEITVYSGPLEFHYVVVQVMRLEERGVPLEQRIQNARWILPSTDERLTLVTCWPITSNTHRLIIVARREG